jgi:class 3 adenylate cyclase
MTVSQLRLFSPRLIFKITLPYLALAFALALAATFVVARIHALSVADVLTRQMNESHLRVVDSVVRAERDQVSEARTLARLNGLPEAVQAGDQQIILSLVEPYAVSRGVERVIVLDKSGRALAGIHADGTGVVSRSASAGAASWPITAAALQGVIDEYGDKYTALIDDGEDVTLYTAAPLTSGVTQVGALLVGTTAETLTTRWREANLVDVALYDENGAAIASSFGADPTGTLAFDPELIKTLPHHRELALGSRNYREVVTHVSLRGQTTPQYLGVAISASGQTSLLEQTEALLLAIFALGVIAVILIGVILSQRITRPITALVEAAEGITAGNLNHVLPVTTGDEIGALTASFNSMVGGLRERERMYDILGRFVSPTVAQLVLTRPLDLTGDHKTMTILFTDLRDFTVLAEREEPATVIEGLNAYFQIVVDAADRHGGVVNKFGGDSTLVLFGLTDAQTDRYASAEAAVRAALDICKGLQELNSQRLIDDLPLLTAGIGINTGPVVAGLIGTRQRMEYTVIGDTVNLSARVQALTRELGSNILISEATYTALVYREGLQVVDYGVRRIKGKRDDVRIYGVMKWETDDATD